MKTCSECKGYEKSDGKHPRTTWCGEPKSPRFEEYTYKGNTCNVFKSKRKKLKDAGK